MRQMFVLFSVICVLTLSVGIYAADKEPPETIVFPAKMGDVTFTHKIHADREGTCDSCHPEPFLQDATAPLNYRPPHKKAEKTKTSCAACHVAEGKAFESKGNCKTCHVKKKKK